MVLAALRAAGTEGSRHGRNPKILSKNYEASFHQIYVKHDSVQQQVMFWVKKWLQTSTFVKILIQLKPFLLILKSKNVPKCLIIFGHIFGFLSQWLKELEGREQHHYNFHLDSCLVLQGCAHRGDVRFLIIKTDHTTSLIPYHNDLTRLLVIILIDYF